MKRNSVVFGFIANCLFMVVKSKTELGFGLANIISIGAFATVEKVNHIRRVAVEGTGVKLNIGAGRGHNAVSNHMLANLAAGAITR